MQAVLGDVSSLPRNKFNIFWDEQRMCLSARPGWPGGWFADGGPGGIRRHVDTDFQRFHQMTWTSPITSRLLAPGVRADKAEAVAPRPAQSLPGVGRVGCSILHATMQPCGGLFWRLGLA
jgi:hypothetical protein